MRQLKLALFIIASLSVFISTNSLAAKRKFPHGCKPVGYQFTYGALELKPVSETQKIQTVYLIHNISHRVVELEAQKLAHHPVSPGYVTELDGDLWTAFVQDEPIVKFTCKFVYGDDEKQTTACNEVLELCQYPRAKFAGHNGGSYWVKQQGESLKQAIDSVIENGVLLRW